MVIDIFFFVVFIYTFYVGFSRGIIQTIFVGISVFVGLIAALKFSPFMVKYLDEVLTAQATIVSIMAFVMTFLIVMLSIRLIASLIENALDAADLEMLNKFAGGILFSALGVLVYSGILIFLNKAHLFTPGVINDSAFYPYLENFPSQIATLVKKILPFIGDLWDTTIHTMDDAKDALEHLDSNNVH